MSKSDSISVLDFLKAVQCSDMRSIEHYIRAGGCVNACDGFDGASALHLACANNDASVCARLIKAGASGSAKTDQGVGVLEYGCAGGADAKTLALVSAVCAPPVDACERFELLRQSALVQNTQALHFWVSVHGFEVDAVDADGWSVLLHACASGCQKSVATLLQLGADPKVCYADGISAPLDVLLHGYEDACVESACARYVQETKSYEGCIKHLFAAGLTLNKATIKYLERTWDEELVQMVMDAK